MSNYQYRPNMHRNVTRKWAEARQVDYGGDDWGDDPYASYEEPVQKPLSYDRRAQTNPPIMNTFQRSSFEQGDERRNLHSASGTSSTAGFPAFDNAQPATSRFYADQSTFAPPARQQTMPAHMQQSSRDTDPLAHLPANTFARDSARPESRGSNAASTSSQTRKTSLGQSDHAADTSKPLPFVRPADIYKRMEEEKEKERRSQDSSRPSMDSIQRDNTSAATNVLQPTAFDPEANRRRQQPTLDTVAERKSEYGLENQIDTTALQTAGPSSVRPIDTQVSQQPSIPSASSKYTDRRDPLSATTGDSRSPITGQNQHVKAVESAPTVPPKDNRAMSSSTSGNLQHQPSSGYKTLVRDAFESENRNRNSPGMSQDSILRSNTASTSEISPIVERARDQPWRETSRQLPSTNERFDEDLSAPQRIGTTRRDNPSPARQPLSVVSHDIPEPRSALAMEDSVPTPVTKDTATQAQILRPGPAILIHQQPRSKDYIHNQDTSLHPNAGLPSLRTQDSQASGSSEQRSASDEWQEWSAARREFNAKHGIKDSNPTTPGPESRNTPPLVSARDSSDNQFRTTQQSRSQDTNRPIIPTTTNVLSAARTDPTQDDRPAIPTTTNMLSPTRPDISRDEGPVIATTTNTLPTSRPDMSRDNESFRPSLPGGWQSSTDVNQTTEPTASTLPSSTYGAKPTTSTAPTSMLARPPLANTRSESAESVPTATAPKREDWRSDYTGPQAQAFASARTAGSALTGVFPTPHSTSTTTADSEVSSINEGEEGSISKNRDTSTAVRDPAVPATQPMNVPKHSSARDFAGAAVVAGGASALAARGRNTDTTGSAPNTYAASGAGSGSSAIPARIPSLQKQRHSLIRDESPSKASDRWWSDEEDEPHPTTSTDVPAPLRTSRSMEPRANSRPSTSHKDAVNIGDHDQLETDIVKSLTPKTSAAYPITEHGRRAHDHDIGQSRNDDSRSPPFAAAALALSPSRGRDSLEERNIVDSTRSPHQAGAVSSSGVTPLTGGRNPAETSSKPPLSVVTPQGDHMGTTVPLRNRENHHGDVAKPLAIGGAAILAGRELDHQHGGNTASVSKPLPADPASTQQSAIGTSSTHKPQSPALARLNSAAKKEFTIMSDEPMTSPISARTPASPTSVHTQATRGELLEQAASAPESSPIAKHLTGSTVTKQYPERATANAAVTIPSPTNKGSDLAPVHENAIDKALDESAAVAGSTRPLTHESRDIHPPTSIVAPSHESPTSGTATSERTVRPSTPTSRVTGPTSMSTPTSKVGPMSTDPSSASVTPQNTKLAALAHPYDPNTAFPSDKVPSSQIVGMQTAQQRIKAYNDNREAYIQPVGHLESWLSTMNTPEHADVFSGQRTTAPIHPTPSPRAASAYSGPSGTRQMQEDGRRLLEGAKKYSGKASVLGKGLLSKGKEKLRTASASNKGSRKTSIASGPSPHSSASGSAPQLPPPSTTTPIGEEMVSNFFASHRDDNAVGLSHTRGTDRDTTQAPFTPISAVSTRDNNHTDQLYRPISGINEDQTPRAQHFGKSGIAIPVDGAPKSNVDAADKRKSGGAVSVLDSSQEGGRYSTDRLNPVVDEERRNSSVSDVSSVSDKHIRRQSLAARTVSPPIEQQTNRNIPPYSSIALPALATAPLAVSAAKAAEASEDRTEESTLPRYSQSTGQASKIAPGTQVVPVSQMGENHTEREDQQRPFSFVGNDSLLHSGDRQHTIDSPDATLRNTNRQSAIAPLASNKSTVAGPVSGVASNEGRLQSENPLPSARRPPQETANFRQTPAPFVSQEEDAGYVIPGPYTRELRSPKPKTHSPIKEQSAMDDHHHSSSPALDTAAAAAVMAGVAANRRDQTDHTHVLQSDHHQPYEPQHQQPYLQQQMESTGPASRPGKDRSRKNSRLGGFFGTRNKSPVRNQQEDRPRFDSDNRRNSLFKLGSRTSVSSRGDEGQINDDVYGQKTRPSAGQRRLSKDPFKSVTFNQYQPGQANYNIGQEPLSAPPTKKKRFSGLFGRSSREQVPTRSSTLPFPVEGSQAQSQDFHRHPAEQQRYSTIEPGQSSQGGRVPYEGYYGQHDGDHSQNRAYDPRTEQTGQMVQQHQYNDPQATGHQQLYHQRSDQREQQPSTLYGSDVSRSQGLPQAPMLGAAQGLTSHPFHQQQQQDRYNQYASDQRPDLRLDTGDRPSGFAAASAPPVPRGDLQSQQRSANQTTPLTAIPGYQQTQPHVPHTHANKDISYGSEYRPGAGAPVSQYNQSMVASPASNISSQVQGLHKRSRSPKLGRPTSEDLTEEINALSASAVGGLGTFSNKKVSPAGGIPRSPEEQEKPWTIGLPGEDNPAERAQSDAAANNRAREIRRIMLEKTGGGNNGNNVVASDSTSVNNRPQTVAERFIGQGMPAPKASGKAPQTPVPTSTSTTAGKVPSPKASSSSFSINRNPSLRGKGPTLSRSGTPVQSNADLARTWTEQSSHTGSSAPRSTTSGVPPVPTARADHLGTSQTGERNEQYPASTIAALASQNRANATGRKQEAQSTSTMPTESVRNNTTTGQPNASRFSSTKAKKTSSGIPAGILPDREETRKRESAYDARRSMANAPTPPPEEPKNVRGPPEAGKSFEVHELVGSRPEGYESDDEPLMSATAYPGQEWQPVFDLED